MHQQVEVMSGFGAAVVTVFLTKASAEPSRAEGLDAEDPDIIDVTQMKENLPKKAVQDYEKALDEKKKGKLESAIKLLEDAIHLAPNFYHAHNNLGMLYQVLKRYPDAEKEFKRTQREERTAIGESGQPVHRRGGLTKGQRAVDRSDAGSGNG